MGADLGDFLGGLDLLRALLEIADGLGDGHVDAALQVHRVHAGGNRLGTFLDDRLGENGRRGGAVTGLVVGLRGDLAQQLGAEILELVLELDLLGDGDAVLGDAGRAERLLDHDVAALRTQRDLDGVGEDVDAAQQLVAGVGGELYVFGSHVFCSLGLLAGLQKAAEGSPLRGLLAGGLGVEDAQNVATPS